MMRSQEQDDLDNMPEDLQGATKRGKELRTWLTHWSAPRWAAAMRLLPARRRCSVSTNIADEMRRSIGGECLGSRRTRPASLGAHFNQSSNNRSSARTTAQALPQFRSTSRKCELRSRLCLEDYRPR